MYRYQILIEYEGTKFIGWQTQKKGNSVQKTIEIILSRLLKTQVKLIGAGRTDAGVHALEQSAHFETTKIINNKKKLLNSLNHFLKKKLISIISIINEDKLSKNNKGANAYNDGDVRHRLYQNTVSLDDFHAQPMLGGGGGNNKKKRNVFGNKNEVL